MTQYRPTREEFRIAIWRAAIPPLFLLAALAAFVSVLLFQLLRANAWTQKSEELVSRTYELEQLLASMESGMRGYLLSGDQEFYGPYLQSRSRLDAALNDLDASLRDMPLEQDHLHALREAMDQWFATEPRLKETTQQSIDADQLAIMRERNTIMDGIRKQIGDLIAIESDLRENRYAGFERASRLAIFGSIGVSMCLGIGLALLNRRTIFRLTALYQQVLDTEAAHARQIEAMNKQFIDLAEAIPQMVWICDEQGRPTYFNSSWSAFTGLTQEQLTQGGWEKVLHTDDHDAVIAWWRDALQTGRNFEVECRLRQSDGQYTWFLGRATPVRDQAGRNSRWFGTCTDINVHKRMQQDRERLLGIERTARADLQRANVIKDQFLATLSHELRTPMTAILGWTQLLQDPAIRQAKLDHAMESIGNNARMQARLIEDLLDMSRILSGKFVLKLEWVDLRKVVQAAVDSLAHEVAARKIELVQQVDPSGDVKTWGDAARLQQIVWNLLSNALKFTPPGGRVALSFQHEEGGAVVRIEDKGRGINPQFLPFVFDRFRQADGSTTRRHGGLGLGLAIVKHLVELHGGSVTAYSEGEGRGATFTVRLPMNREPAEAMERTDASATEERTADSNGKAPLAGLKLLIVADERDTTEILGEILRRVGASVEIAFNGFDAIAAMERGAFDVLISDIGMPEMDGYGLIRRVRELETGSPRHMPAIAVTAFAHKEDREEALAAGYQMHIPKPIAADQLIRAVGQLARPVAS